VIRPGTQSLTAGALRYLWARHRIAELSDQEQLEGDGGERQAILDLGLKYNLLTQYTSFVAIDRIVRLPNPDGSVTVDQPLPLPKGVSDLAVSAPVPGTPEPSIGLLIGIACLALAAMMLRDVRLGRAPPAAGA
jgi:Ca-activated chloride channel family protein